MNTDSNRLEFVQTGHFYDMVTTFMAAIAGLGSIFDQSNPMNFREKDVLTVEGKVHKEIYIPLFSLHQLAISGKITSDYMTANLSSMLINTAYESVKHSNDQSPVFEFFRHFRNASSHKNTFNFWPQEPSKSAHWRGKHINHTVKGANHPLHGTACFPTFVTAADAILLLWDVEQLLNP